MIKKGYRIPPKAKGCRFAYHYNDSVPMPFGSGNCFMPGFDCIYLGSKKTQDVCDENSNCPAYEPELTKICQTHDVEYYAKEWCGLCFPEEEY